MLPHTKSVPSRLSHVQLFEIPWTVASQAPLYVGFSRQEHGSGLPCPPPGDLPDPGIKYASLRLLHWQVSSLYHEYLPTPVFLPGESQGRGSLVGCRLWGRTESDTTEATEQQQPPRKPKMKVSRDKRQKLNNDKQYTYSLGFPSET